MKHLLITFFFLILLASVSAQSNVILVSGKIVDNNTSEPIPFANISIEETALGTMSNIDGEFELKIQEDYREKNLLISCIGYKTEKCNIAEKLTIRLKSETYELSEIVIRPLKAIEILKNAIAEIPNNYQNKTTHLDAFYRNLFLEDTTYINLAEASCIFNYSSYTDNYNVFEAQKSYYNNKRLINCSWTEGVNNYFDLYTSPNDQVKINEARISEYNSKTFDKYFVIGGPLNLIASDKVKYPNDFMDAEHFKHYNYRVEDITMYNGNEVVIISFEPKRIQFRNYNPGYAKYANRKKYYNAEFKGKIFIERDSKAFVRIEYDLVKVKKGQRMQPLKRAVQIDYKKHDNKWYLSQISRIRQNEGFKKQSEIDSVTIEEQLIVNKIETKNVSKFAESETIPHSNFFTLNRYPTAYNQDFWDNSNIITYNKLNNKASSDLQKTKTLERQFADMQQRNDSMPAPRANTEEQKYHLHNFEISDNYKWLENKDASSVAKYLNEENKYSYNYFIPYRELQKELQNEMIERVPERKETQIYNKRIVGNYVYYDKYLQENEYPVIYRKDTLAGSSEEVLFNCQKLSQKYDEFYLSETYISPNNKHIAFCIDTIGNERYTCLIYNIESKQLFAKETIPDFWNLVWAKSGKSFYYIRQDSNNRPSSLYKHKIGTDIKTDSLIYFEKDMYSDLSIRKSELGNYLFITTSNYTESETKYINLVNESDKINLFCQKTEGHKYSIKEDEQDFYILSNYDAINYRLYKTSKEQTNFAHWKNVVLPKTDTLISSFYLTKNYVVLNQIFNVGNHVSTINKKTLKSNEIQFNEPISTMRGIVTNYASDSIVLSVNSFIEPTKYYSYHLKNNRLSFIQQDSINKYNKNDYIAERLWCVSDDSTRVPISIIYKKGTLERKKKNATPLILEAYGAYGSNNLPAFSIDKICMLDRGFIYAIAHVRGSSVLGNEWYEQGRMLNKKNTIKDYIACAEYLIEKKYTDNNSLFGIGGSAGGMIMGASANKRPELFKGIVLEYPAVCFLDWLSIEKNSNVLEFGNPINDKNDFVNIYSYSPYENIQSQNYPAMLFISGYNDFRVPYWNSTKMVAKLRNFNTGKAPILLKTYSSGHTGGSSRYDYYKSMAYEYSFILSQIK